MAKDFSFPFYVNNWLGGTVLMTFEQKGAYLELLLLQFNHGRFTETHVKHMLNTCFSHVWPMIQHKFNTDGTYYWNDRMEEVKKERMAYVESRRNNRKNHKNKEKVPLPQDRGQLSYVKHMEGEGEGKDKEEGYGGVGERETKPGSVLVSDGMVIPSPSTSQQLAFSKAYASGNMTEAEFKAGSKNYKPETYGNK